jgi:hypothetical protein
MLASAASSSNCVAYSVFPPRQTPEALPISAACRPDCCENAQLASAAVDQRNLSASAESSVRSSSDGSMSSSEPDDSAEDGVFSSRLALTEPRGKKCFGRLWLLWPFAPR